MAISHAEEPPTTSPPVHAPAGTPWASLGRRQVLDLTLPGVAIGLLTGAIAGALAAATGQPLYVALATAAALGVPLAIAGAGYEVLLARGTVPLGALTPVALYWAVAFPVVRVIQAALITLYAGSAAAVPHGWLDFVVFQVLVSVGFGIGYWWLHENFAPRWWFHVRERNPVADFFIRYQLQYAAAAEQERQSRPKRKSRRSR